MDTTQNTTKKPIQENAQEDWLPNQFNYGASMDQIQMIQERVQARWKDGTLSKQLEKSIKATGTIDPNAVESGIVIALYMHTAFEIGKEAGLSDISIIVDEVITKAATDASK